MKRVGDFSFGDSKPKRQQTAAPSKVLHVRGLPTWCSENELTDIVAPFGNVVECLVIQDKGQAFIELESIDVAQDVLTNLEFSNPSIRGKPIFFQFSSRQKVEKRNRVQNFGGPAESNPGGASGFPSIRMLGGMGPGGMGAGGMGAGGMGAGGMGLGSMGPGGMGSGDMGPSDGTSPILLLMITKIEVQVTVENIHQICSPFGEVLRIVTFDKNNTKQALVEFASIECAASAKHFLEGKDMFQNCCHIRTAYSNRTKLTVKQNNHRMRDFTIDDQRQHPSDLNMPLPFGANPGMLGMQQQHPQMPGGLGRNIANASYGGGMSRGLMGGGMRGMGGMGGMGGMPNLPVLRGMSGNPMHMGGHPSMGMMGASPVVLVSKLKSEKISPDCLFTLFGVYGDVQRVKILFTKRDTALIQYATPEQASLAITYLTGCPLFGTRITVVKSKHPQVKLARQQDQSTDEKELTKDFSGSTMHRYKKGFVNRKNIFPPSRVLHVSNLHESATEQELRNLFSAQQPMAEHEPVVEFFKMNRKMAYVAMNTVENGINALINIHGYKVGGWPIRVSFSPKDPKSIRSSEPENSRSPDPVQSKRSEHPEHPVPISMHTEQSILAEPEHSEHSEHSAHLLMH